MTDPELGALIGRPVSVHDVRLGTVTGVYGDGRFARVIGLEVSSPDGRRRFLPWVVSRADDGTVAVQSAFLLVDVGELDSYLRLGARLERDPAALAGLSATPDGRVAGKHDENGVSAEAEAGIRAA